MNNLNPIELANLAGAEKRPSIYIVVIVIYLILSTGILVNFSKIAQVSVLTIVMGVLGIGAIAFGLFDLKYPQFLMGFLPGLFSIGIGLTIILFTGLNLLKYPTGIYVYIAGLGILLSCFFVGINKIEKNRLNPLSIAVFRFTPITENLSNVSKTLHHTLLKRLDKEIGRKSSIKIIDLNSVVQNVGTPDQRVDKAKNKANNVASIILYGDIIGDQSDFSVSPYIIAEYPLSNISEVVFELPMLKGKSNNLSQIEQALAKDYLPFIFGFKLWELGKTDQALEKLEMSGLHDAKFYTALLYMEKFRKSNGNIQLLLDAKKTLTSLEKKISKKHKLYWYTKLSIVKVHIDLYQNTIPQDQQYLRIADSLVDQLIESSTFKDNDISLYHNALSKKGLIEKMKASNCDIEDRFELLKSSRDYLIKTFEFFEQEQNNTELLAISHNLTLTYYDLSFVADDPSGVMEQSKLWIKRAITYSTKNHDKVKLIELYSFLGDIMKRTYTFDKNENHLKESLIFYTKAIKRTSTLNKDSKSFLVEYRKATILFKRNENEVNVDKLKDVANTFRTLSDELPDHLEKETSCDILNHCAAINFKIGSILKDPEWIISSTAYNNMVIELLQNGDLPDLLKSAQDNLRVNKNVLETYQQPE